MKINPYNPFERISEIKLALYGISLTILASILGSLLNARFDGILDLHFVNESTFLQVLSDNVINIAFATILLYILGKKIYKKTRFIDILNAVCISRFFIYISLAFNIQGFISQQTDNLLAGFPEIKFDVSFFWVTAIGFLMILFVIYYIIYMFWGFRVATNSKQKIHILYFVITLIIVEIITKNIIIKLNI